MAESTLTAAYKDLTGQVGFHLGYGRGADNSETTWDTNQQRTIDQLVRGGLRKFYYCGHDWSFLHPVATFTLASGTKTFPLPEDFGGVEGQATVTLPSGTSASWWCLDIGGIGDVLRAEAQASSTTGTPQCMCVEPIKGTGAQGQRSQLHYWPTTDQSYTLKVQYYVNPDYLSGQQPYAYGGPEHAETLLAACKATGEIDLDDQRDGPQFQEFTRLLEISKTVDARKKPQTVGYNRDHSDYRYGEGWPKRRIFEDRVTFNGVAYAALVLATTLGVMY